jgi:hypothetical protein
MQETPLDKTLNDYIARTTKSRIAVIVPLFGYWKDASSDQLNAETLKLSLDRVYSSVHQIYIIFVGDISRMTAEVGNVLAKYQKAGNCRGVSMKRKDTYSDYIREGFRVALQETDAGFVVNLNPWLLFQHNGLDILIDRINQDDIKIVSGFDLRGIIDPSLFNKYQYQIPQETREINLDFVGMKRLTAEMITLDENYKTHIFLARDMWQSLFAKGFEAVVSQRIPIFTFEVDWKELESETDFETDRQYFISKNKFDPGIKYV